ncbi:MAG: YicC family protein [Clostridia bacterium]|nr:YicC family protein [Clostridia bacterium]
MLKSMTAFGRARSLSADASLDITAEIKSVNSRYLDITVKLPRMYSFLEDRVRAYVSEKGISRGKVEVYIGVDVLIQKGLEIDIDEGAAASYLAALEKLRDRFGLKDDITAMKVASNKDIFIIKKAEDDMEKDWAEVRPVLSDAIDAFCGMRAAEGERLCLDIMKKAEGLREMADRVRTLSEKDIGAYPEKLTQRIKQLLSDYDIEIAEQRILTESAIFADRAAIDEEIVRLGSHFTALDGILRSDEAAGRKLDFLVQEINREINTAGSKSQNSEIAHIIVDMKTELEKIREQIQNLE